MKIRASEASAASPMLPQRQAPPARAGRRIPRGRALSARAARHRSLACRAPAGSRFGKVRNSPSSSRNTTPAACTLSRVRVHAAAQTSAHASAARRSGPRARPPGRQGPPGLRRRRATPAERTTRPSSVGGCRAGGRQASAGAGQQSFRQLGTHWWSGARSCGRAKFTPRAGRGCRFSPEWIAWLCPARPRRIRPCPAFEPPPRPWRPDAGCRAVQQPATNPPPSFR